MGTIELGELTGAEPAPPAGPPDRHRTARRLATALAVLGVVASGGSARPAPPAVRPAWSTPLTESDEVGFTDDTAYVSRARDGRLEITAYEVATGRIRWTAPVDDLGPAAPEPVDPVVLLRTDPVSVDRVEPGGDRATTYFYRSTIALDARTGGELWRAPGEISVTGAGTALLVEHDPAAEPVRLSLVDVRDGRRRWTRSIRHVRAWTVVERDGSPAEVVTVGDDNRVTFLDAARGSVTRTGRLPGRITTVSVLGGYLLAVDSPVSDASHRETTTVFRSADLAPTWRADTSAGGLVDCGVLLCTTSGAGLSAHDPATGREVWRRPGPDAALPMPGGRLLLYALRGDGSTVVVDGRTGRAVGRPVAGQMIWSSRRHDSVLVLRHTTDPPGSVSITRLRVDSGAATLLGVIDPVLDIACWDLEHYLACPDDGHLEVTDLG